MSKKLFYMILAVLLVGFTGAMINAFARERIETKKSNSMITVTTPGRAMPSLRQSEPIVEREFTIEFLDAGIGVFDFTFG